MIYKLTNFFKRGGRGQRSISLENKIYIYCFGGVFILSEKVKKTTINIENLLIKTIRRFLVKLKILFQT